MSDNSNRVKVVRPSSNRNPGPRDPIEFHLRKSTEDHNYFTQKQVGLDKIVEDSGSTFFMTGKNVRLNVVDFLHLLEKHDINDVENLEQEEIVISSHLMTELATAENLDPAESELEMIDATAVGLFIGSFLLAVFGLLTKTMADIKTFSWIILGVSGFFLLHYSYRGIKSGRLKKMSKAWLRKASRNN